MEVDSEQQRDLIEQRKKSACFEESRF